MSPEENERISVLAANVFEGDKRAIGQAISLFENAGQSSEADALMSELWPHTGSAATIGITGPAGVGKSTLTSEVVGHLSREGKNVGVIAVDPSSHISQGALLGDRVRMSEHFLNPDIFIRSMGSRGKTGGTSEASFLAMSVLDAAGKDVVIVETVGVGQSEVDIQSLVETVAVVLQPGSGDSIQAMKSGLMEIPDVLCMNKNDHPEAHKTARELKSIMSLMTEGPLFVETNASNGSGIDRFWEAIETSRDILGEEGLQNRRRKNLSNQLASIVTARLFTPEQHRLKDQTIDEALDNLYDKTLDPLEVVRLTLEALRTAKD